MSATVDRLDAAGLIERLVRDALPTGRRSPLVVGICGAQGSGKTTACTAAAAKLNAAGVRTCSLSLDDLYLPKDARQALARTVHPLLAVRGVPGTHDVALGIAILDALGREGPVAIPRFDKARDDRRPAAELDVLAGPLDVVLFEGWCVGARPQPADALQRPVNRLEAKEDADGRWRAFVNAQLAGPYQQLFTRLDRLVLLAAPCFEIVAPWRSEQEAALRASVGVDAPEVMDQQAIERFVLHYERLTRHILNEMPARADLTIDLDPQRRVSGARQYLD